MPAEKRFIHCASAVGVAATISSNKPGDTLNQFWASSALPVIGGQGATGLVNGVRHPLFSFDSTETSVSGTEISAGVYQTQAAATVKGVNVFNGGLTARAVRASVRFTFDSKLDRLIDVVVDATYEGLTVDGKSVQINLEPDLAATAGNNPTEFRRILPMRRPGKHHFTHGSFFTTLAQDHPLLNADPDDPADHGFHDFPGFGRIYFAEWSADVERDRQCLTMLRVRPNAPYKGQIVIADPSPNGQPYP